MTEYTRGYTDALDATRPLVAKLDTEVRDLTAELLTVSRQLHDALARAHTAEQGLTEMADAIAARITTHTEAAA